MLFYTATSPQRSFVAVVEIFHCNLKGQSHQDLMLLENPMTVLVLIRSPLAVTYLTLLKCIVLVTKVVDNC